MLGQDEIYVSTDIEADGPIPGPHSMLSLGSAAYSGEGRLIETFSINLECLEGARGDLATMDWWKDHPELWRKARENAVPPSVAMPQYASWLKRLPGRPVFVGYPITFDFLFVHWYLIRFAGEDPFRHCALDIRGFALALMESPLGGSVEGGPPRPRAAKLPDTHVALVDAIEQGKIFCRSLGEQGLPPAGPGSRPSERPR